MVGCQDGRTSRLLKVLRQLSLRVFIWEAFVDQACWSDLQKNRLVEQTPEVPVVVVVVKVKVMSICIAPVHE